MRENLQRALPVMGALVRLTAREVDVLRLLARGCTYARAADRLGVSPHTIGAYIKSSYQKLGVHSAGAAIMRAVELGILAMGDPAAERSGPEDVRRGPAPGSGDLPQLRSRQA